MSGNTQTGTLWGRAGLPGAESLGGIKGTTPGLRNPSTYPRIWQQTDVVPPRLPFYYFILKWSSPSQMRFSSLFLKTWKWSHQVCYFWKKLGQIDFLIDFWNRFRSWIDHPNDWFFRWDVSWACIKLKEKQWFLQIFKIIHLYTTS